MTATLNGQAWSRSWSRDSVWPGWRSRHSSSENSRGLRSIDLAVERDPPRGLVEDDRAGDELRLRATGGRAAPAERPEPGRQLLVGERLDEVVVGAGVEPGHPVADRVARGQHQDRHLGPRRPDAAGDLETRDVGQPDVEDDDLDAARRLGDVEAVEAGRGRLDHVAILFEQATKQADQPRIVLDDEQMHRLQPTPSITGRR